MQLPMQANIMWGFESSAYKDSFEYHQANQYVAPQQTAFLVENATLFQLTRVCPDYSNRENQSVEKYCPSAQDRSAYTRLSRCSLQYHVNS